MSTWRERVSGETDPGTAYEWLEANYHYPVVALLMVFGFWLRTVHWERSQVGDTILFGANDPYYHYRSVEYVVEHWPATMPFDPWTNFPIGTATAQFGTLLDQLIATAALILGLGSPSESLVRHVFLFAPPVLGVLTFIPAYLIGRRLGGKFGGVVAVGVLAFANGRLFRAGWVGSTDHHVAEALFQAIAVLGLMVALTAAEEEKPVYELAAERAFGTMRRTLGWGVLAGIATALYMFVWPPGVFLLGALGVFFVVVLSAEFLRGRSPEHVAIVGAVAMATTGVLVLSTVNATQLRATSRSLLQPLVAFGVAGGCLVMAWLARVFDERDLPDVGYPTTVVGLAAVFLGLIAVVAPATFDYLIHNVMRVVGLGYATSETAATVQEVSPMPAGDLIDYYSLATFAALGGALIALVRQIRPDGDPRSQELLVVVWMAFVLLASLTQVRFTNYLTIPIAALCALLAGSVVGFVNSTSTDEGVQTYQVLTVGVVVMLVLAPMVIVVPGSDRSTAVSVGTNEFAKDPGFGIRGWQSSLEFMQENTPEPGQFGDPDGEAMEYLGTYDRTDDYNYDAGAYGVLAWWDYGHWITTEGHRIPNANPFQQGADHAAQFLLAENESRALDELVDRDEDDAETRYTMIDWQMAQLTSKGSAPISFVDGLNASDFFSYVIGEGQGTLNVLRHKQRFYDSMVTRLYHYHGSSQEPRPIVLEWRGAEQVTEDGLSIVQARRDNQSQFDVVSEFDTMTEAREYVAEQPANRQLGGYGAYPTERVPALEHFRLVHTSDFATGPNLGYDRILNGTSPTAPSWTKTFERVPGATIEGTVDGTDPADRNVTLAVQLQPEGAPPFTYRQQTQSDGEGNFEFTVPYATTGDDEWGVEEGYTDTSVEALGPYEVSTGLESEDNTTFWYGDQVNVTEGQVLGEDDSVASATLEREELDLGNATDTGGNDSGEQESDDAAGLDVSGGNSDGTDAAGGGTGGDDAGNDGEAGGNETSPALAPPASGAIEPRAVQP